MSASPPIHRVPPEVLGLIFSTFQQPIYFHTRKQFNNSIILKLSLVCSQWRETVLSSPRLWSWIMVKYYWRENWVMEDIRSQAAEYRQRAEVTLARAGNTPLKISLVGSNSAEDAPEFPLTLNAVLDVLVCRSNQWAELDFTGISHPFLEQRALQLVKSVNLRSLSIDLELYPDLDEAIERIPGSFKNCLSLRFITLLPCLSLNAPFPWSQIQKMTLDLYQASQLALLQLLSHCWSLNTLDLRLRGSYGSRSCSVAGYDGSHHVSTNVESLSLLNRSEDFSRYRFFFRRIEFPKLSYLEICQDSILPRDIAPLLDLFYRSPSPITFLSLKTLHIPEQQLFRLFELTPMLLTLEITDTRPRLAKASKKTFCASRFLSELLINDNITNTLSPPPILPRLRTLVLRVYQRNFDFDKLYAGVKPRCPDATIDGLECLHSLAVLFRDEPKDLHGLSSEEWNTFQSGVARLELLRDTGLEVLLKDVPGYID
ncbi:hypothetical protein L218DRAFT_336379 [Marasmius fiardii PR-910]|nr:hypothetical protein L218DRAFT_336379 [Marasmius fiardii PR-910]